MTSRPATVISELELRLVVPGGASVPVFASLRYTASDPYAVHVAFHAGGTASGTTVEWTFARQLLTDGVTHRVGEGDVAVWPSQSSRRPTVCLSLSSPSGRALFEVPLVELVEFLTETYTAVPTGSESEYVDLDAELALLLWTEPGL